MDNSPHRDRLWTPWRMRYVTGGPAEDGCIFCNRIDRKDDIESLILHRAERCFVMMNLFPYNTGHLMVVPNQHVAEIDHLDADSIAEMAQLLSPVTRALRRVLSCDGFNIGFNQGSIAGAGVAEHLHQHVVPRWQGDANFMPILAGTMVIPELIPSTYAKLRAELDAQVHDVSRFEIVLLDDAREPSVWLQRGQLPAIERRPELPVWRSALTQLDLADAEIVGYSGGATTRDRTTPPGLVIRGSTRPSGAGWTRLPLSSQLETVDISPTAVTTLGRIRQSLAPWNGNTTE